MGIYTFILIILYCYASVKWVMLFPVSSTPATCFLLYTFEETWYLYGIILHFIKHLLPLLAFKKKNKEIEWKVCESLFNFRHKNTGVCYKNYRKLYDSTCFFELRYWSKGQDKLRHNSTLRSDAVIKYDSNNVLL